MDLIKHIRLKKSESLAAENLGDSFHKWVENYWAAVSELQIRATYANLAEIFKTFYGTDISSVKEGSYLATAASAIFRSDYETTRLTDKFGPLTVTVPASVRNNFGVSQVLKSGGATRHEATMGLVVDSVLYPSMSVCSFQDLSAKRVITTSNRELVSTSKTSCLSSDYFLKNNEKLPALTRYAKILNLKSILSGKYVNLSFVHLAAGRVFAMYIPYCYTLVNGYYLAEVRKNLEEREKIINMCDDVFPRAKEPSIFYQLLLSMPRSAVRHYWRTMTQAEKDLISKIVFLSSNIEYYKTDYMFWTQPELTGFASTFREWTDTIRDTRHRNSPLSYSPTTAIRKKISGLPDTELEVLNRRFNKPLYEIDPPDTLFEYLELKSDLALEMSLSNIRKGVDFESELAAGRLTSLRMLHKFEEPPTHYQLAHNQSLVSKPNVSMAKYFCAQTGDDILRYIGV